LAKGQSEDRARLPMSELRQAAKYLSERRTVLTGGELRVQKRTHRIMRGFRVKLFSKVTVPRMTAKMELDCARKEEGGGKGAVFDTTDVEGRGRME